MNFKKFLSTISAVTIAASAFAGMFVTASAIDLKSESIAENNDMWTNYPANELTADYQLVYEADVTVPTGGKTSVAYYGGNNSKGFPKSLGPTFIFDDTDGDGWVTISYSIAQGDPTLLYKNNESWSKYKAGYTIHVKITTPQIKKGENPGIENSTIEISGSDDAFTQQRDDGSYVQRKPYLYGGTITARNLNADAANENVRAIRTTISGAAVLSNVHVYTERLTITDAPLEMTASYSNDNGACVYSGIITNDTINGLTTVSAKATPTEGEAVSSAEHTITEIAPNSTISLAVVVANKTADDLNSVTVTLK